MVNNERKGICSGWQHEDWHRGKEQIALYSGNCSIGVTRAYLARGESPAMRLERLAGSRAW